MTAPSAILEVVTAESPIRKEVTGAMPLTLFISKRVVSVLAPEFHCEIGEGDAVLFLSVALSFVDFAN